MLPTLYPLPYLFFLSLPLRVVFYDRCFSFRRHTTKLSSALCWDPWARGHHWASLTSFCPSICPSVRLSYRQPVHFPVSIQDPQGGTREGWGTHLEDIYVEKKNANSFIFSHEEGKRKRFFNVGRKSPVAFSWCVPIPLHPKIFQDSFQCFLCIEQKRLKGHKKATSILEQKSTPHLYIGHWDDLLLGTLFLVETRGKQFFLRISLYLGGKAPINPTTGKKPSEFVNTL